MNQIRKLGTIAAMVLYGVAVIGLVDYGLRPAQADGSTTTFCTGSSPNTSAGCNNRTCFSGNCGPGTTYCACAT